MSIRRLPAYTLQYSIDLRVGIVSLSLSLLLWYMLHILVHVWNIIHLNLFHIIYFVYKGFITTGKSLRWSRWIWTLRKHLVCGVFRGGLVVITLRNVFDLSFFYVTGIFKSKVDKLIKWNIYWNFFRLRYIK